MGYPQDGRTAVADQIIRFAVARCEKLLYRGKERIIFEFNRLEERINQVAPYNRAGDKRDVTYLSSKALWCCYPEDVPIFDRNSACALKVIS